VEQEAGPKPEQKTDTEGQEELEVQMTSNGILRHALFIRFNLFIQAWFKLRSTYHACYELHYVISLFPLAP
jgi:hypothetical protein